MSAVYQTSETEEPSMSRRFCCVLWCGLACLMLGQSGNAVAADAIAVRTVSMAMPSYGGFAMAPQMMDTVMDGGYAEGAYMHGDVVESPVTAGVFGAGVYGFGELDITPKGTLGQTYTRVSHPVPMDKHPRTGMLAVKDNGTVPYLSVGVMGGIKMKNGIWLFESTRPLDVGACQIVRVEARETPQDIEPYATRFVRLIPGRIVYLEF
jgi:hypothetical protein